MKYRNNIRFCSMLFCMYCGFAFEKKYAVCVDVNGVIHVNLESKKKSLSNSETYYYIYTTRFPQSASTFLYMSISHILHTTFGIIQLDLFTAIWQYVQFFHSNINLNAKNVDKNNSEHALLLQSKYTANKNFQRIIIHIQKVVIVYLLSKQCADQTASNHPIPTLVIFSMVYAVEKISFINFVFYYVLSVFSLCLQMLIKVYVQFAFGFNYDFFTSFIWYHAMTVCEARREAYITNNNTKLYRFCLAFCKSAVRLQLYMLTPAYTYIGSHVCLLLIGAWVYKISANVRKYKNTQFATA